MTAPHPSRKPWKEMALLLGWKDHEEVEWFVKVWGGSPTTHHVLRHDHYAACFYGRRRWEEAVKYSKRFLLEREKAVGKSRAKVDRR